MKYKTFNFFLYFVSVKNTKVMNSNMKTCTLRLPTFYSVWFFVFQISVISVKYVHIYIKENLLCPFYKIYII